MGLHHCSSLLPVELTPATAEAILLAWLFAMGGAVGSFLNVVIYRLPAGKSLVHPGSHCPACKHPIRWHDNVPVLSWFLLRGRCRDCGTAISSRYPTVEAITAVLFVAVGAIEGLSGGANLPLEPVVGFGGAVLPPLDLAQSAAMAGYHLLLVSTLLAAALIEFDGHRLPRRLVVPALVVGWLGPILWPGLHPVPAGLPLAGPIAGIVDTGAGCLAGLVLGAIVWRLVREPDRLGWLLMPTCVGTFLGWQAIVVLTAVTVLLCGPFLLARRRWPGLRPIPPTAWLTAATVGWILAWGSIVHAWPWLG